MHEVNETEHQTLSEVTISNIEYKVKNMERKIPIVKTVFIKDASFYCPIPLYSNPNDTSSSLL